MAITRADTWEPKVGIPYPFRRYRPLPEELAHMPEELYDSSGNLLPGCLLYWAKLFPQMEENAVKDPIGWCWRVSSWDMVLSNWQKYHTHIILGGNRSSKSSLACRIANDMAITLPGARIRCWSTNESTSVTEQQRMMWESMPEAYKEKNSPRAQRDFSISYTQKNGFSGNKLIYPPVPGATEGGEVLFQTYKAWAQDEQISEGWWAHLVWGDEEMPVRLYERFLTRIRDAKGRILMTFTTLNGWTPLVADILSKTRTLKRRYSDLVGRELPVMQESLSRPGTAIYYFWTQDNAFFDTDDFLRDLRARPIEERLCIAHGIPVRSSGSKFPLFDDQVHVVKHETLPWITKKDYKVSRYMVLDPAGRKNWFMLWVAVDSADTIWVYREWPDESFGDWAEPGNDTKGRAGPGSKGLGFGIKDYRRLIEECEGGETVHLRLIDPRLGTAEKQGKEGATSIQTELEEEGLAFEPAPGLDIEHGLQLINSRLAYDTTQVVSAVNAPRIYISDRCANLIFALKNYTADGGKDEASKDPIDCLRMLLEAGVEYVEGGALSISGGGSY
jgi:phage terminase large subunit-like protein